MDEAVLIRLYEPDQHVKSYIKIGRVFGCQVKDLSWIGPTMKSDERLFKSPDVRMDDKEETYD